MLHSTQANPTAHMHYALRAPPSLLSHVAPLYPDSALGLVLGGTSCTLVQEHTMSNATILIASVVNS